MNESLTERLMEDLPIELQYEILTYFSFEELLRITKNTDKYNDIIKLFRNKKFPKLFSKYIFLPDYLPLFRIIGYTVKDIKNYDRILRRCCYKGNLETLEYIISIGVPKLLINSDIFSMICERGHLNILKYLTSIDIIHSFRKKVYRHGIGLAVKNGFTDVVKYLISYIMERSISLNYCRLLLTSFEYKHLDIIKFIVSLDVLKHSLLEKIIITTVTCWMYEKNTVKFLASLELNNVGSCRLDVYSLMEDEIEASKWWYN